VDGSYDAIASMTLEGVVTTWNPASERIFGYSAIEMTGKPFSAIFPKKRSQELLKVLTTLVEGRGIEQYETTGIGKDGGSISIAITLSPIRDATGRVVGASSIAHDITERKRADNLAMNTVIAKERLNALGQMASGIAHDFNNSLSPILGFSEMLIDQPELLANRDLVLKRLKSIHRASVEAAQMVRRLYEFVRTADDQQAMTMVDLGKVVSDALEIARPSWADQARAKGVEYSIKVSIPEVQVKGIEAELRELVENLILNGVEAMREGGDLRITVSPKRSSGMIALAVTDSGLGMTPQVRARCFEPFFTTKGGAGAGLGLAVCYGIVQRHGGQIDIKTAVGEGTTVTVLLPATAEAQTPNAKDRC
jgi:PAS domain S-box-containing protein